ncbi:MULTISPECIES: GAF domain-containing sensor histidine kinase [unclassified Frankia]|uniref:GAF domain-containing sensor histidine kinase n=1 Tax=unclassified Frankia TaxID=2632575 RepID=UPI001933B7EC|nr:MULTISPECIES: GAF domain-containing sensor histidine kinase [unclassified Frankia]MBL7489575.1 GAF domain-containing sensor histidine kinase [Frankia sp. AgW1.1]MBL7624492.1 GAF domain-containing sensor histidine kinase [Frankia sp. AgB1.8]
MTSEAGQPAPPVAAVVAAQSATGGRPAVGAQPTAGPAAAGVHAPPRAPTADPATPAVWLPARQRPAAGARATAGPGLEERIERMLHQLGDRVGDALAAHDRMRGLADALAAVAGQPNLAATLRRAAEVACRLADAQYGAIGVLGPDGRVLDLVQVGPDPAGPARVGRVPGGRGQLGAALRESWAHCLGAAAGEPEAADLPTGQPAFGAFLGAPITIRGAAFGDLYLGGKRGGGPFTSQDEDLVLAFAAAVGLAIENSRLRDEARRQQAWQAASGEITAALVAVPEPWAALDLVASRARQATSACLAAIVIPDPAAGIIVTNADGSGADRLCGRNLPVERSPLVEAMRVGRARVVAGAELADLLGPAAAQLALARVMVVPMVAAGRAVGGLLLGTPETQPDGAPGPVADPLGRAVGVTPFGELDLRMATAFAGQAALTLELNRLQRDRERLAVFEDRDRIARDLHDVVIQRLFATGLQLQGMTRSMPAPVAARVEDVVGELDQTITELRHTIFSLSSPTADGAALRAEIERIAGQAEHSVGLRPAVRIEGHVERVPVVVHPHLLAALREALSNIARHSRATRVQVLVRATDDDVLVEVHDDGVGPGGAGVTSGLANLRSRAHDLGGHMEFGPGPGGVGTRVRWQVPTAERPAPADWASSSTPPPGLPRP